MPRPEFNSQKTGFVIGMILPVVSFLIFYFIRYSDISLKEFVSFVYFRDILSPLLTLNILPNLAVFFLFIRKDFLLSARGVLLATFLFAGLVFVFKVVS